MKINFILNEKEVSCEISPEMTLLTVLKERLHINSVKRACLQGECGACTVIVDGKAVNSCLVPAALIEGKKVETLEGLGTLKEMHPLQKAFAESGAFQCGFCTSGFIMSAKALLDKNPSPTEEEIRYGLAGNLCRCTGYVKPVEALLRYVNETTGEPVETPEELPAAKVNPDAIKVVQAAATILGGKKDV